MLRENAPTARPTSASMRPRGQTPRMRANNLNENEVATIMLQ